MGLFRPAHHRLSIVPGGGQHVGPGEHEQRRQAKQQKIQRRVRAPCQGVKPVNQGRQARRRHRQGHIAVAGLAAQVRPLFPGGPAQLPGQVRPLLQERLRLLEALDASPGLLGEFRQNPGGPIPLPPGQALLRPGAVEGQAGPGLGEVLQQLVHLVLIFEIALLLLSAAVFHHQVGNRREDAPVGKAAGAHGHPLEDPADSRKGQVVTAVQVEAVQIKGLPSHAAGTEPAAGLPVLQKLGPVQGLMPQGDRFDEDHGITP